MLHKKTIKQLKNVFDKYVPDESTQTKLLQELMDIKSTSSHFKITIDELLKYVEKDDKISK